MKPTSRVLIGAIVPLLLISYAGMVYLTISNDYRLTVNSSERQVSTLSSALEQHASRTLGEADSILESTVTHILNQGWPLTLGERQFYDYAVNVHKKTPQIKSVFFVSPDARLFASSTSFPVGNISVADREYYIHHTVNSGSESYVSIPLKSRIDGTWLFSITRRISNPDGSLKMIVGVALDSGYFDKFYQTLDLEGNNGQALLIRTDGPILMNFPFSGDVMTRSMKDSLLIGKYLPNSPQDFFYVNKFALDGIPRIVAYRKSQRYPIVAIVSLSTEKMLEPWRLRTFKNGSGATASMLLILILTWTLIRRLKRLESANETLFTQSHELELAAHVFEKSRQSILITNSDGIILRTNSYFTELTGFTQEECFGKTPRILKSQRQEKAFYAEMWKTLLEEGKWKGELWNRKKNGDGFAALLSISSVRDEYGMIKYFIGINEDITEQKMSSERIYHLAHYDLLTGLPNRQLFNDRFTLAVQQAERFQRSIAILFLDLDNFKKVNDTLGHHAGDVLLQTVSQRIAHTLRKIDSVARLGGDEFAIILEDLKDPSDVKRVAKKIIETISEPVHIDGTPVYVGVSIGASIYPDDGDNIAELFKNADTAMYRAKAAGKNRCQFFDTEMAVLVAERLSLEMDLREGIPNQLFLLYQPQTDLASGRITGVEALVRWRHPRRGVVCPADFIHVAEESGQINLLGKWVLETACRQASYWYHETGRWLRVAVNVSALQLVQPLFYESVENILRECRIPPSLLELELTESIVMSNVEETIISFARLKALGVNIAIDDFGTGYSSLSYLKKLPIDRLKIDRSFITDLPGNKEDIAITRMIIAMARSLNLVVTAEGVEQSSQLDFLKDEGCNEYQGYFLAKPLTTNELENLLKTHENPAKPH